MADTVEIRLEQLTQAIKGLYAKSSMSQGEIYNALTGLSQRYENLVNVSNEKIAATLVSEFRKTLDAKYSQTNQFIKELEGNLRNLMLSSVGQSPKTAAEVTKLLSDTSNIYSKLNSQDLALQKIFGKVELIKTGSDTEEITKLSDNFMQFSRGFDNITSTLNKNFADFLEQIKKYNSKEEYAEIQQELNTITGNVNSVISAISIIDSKYRDLTSLIDTVNHRENVFNDALKEVRALTTSLDLLKESVQAQDPRVDIQALGNDIRNQIENVKYEIQKAVNTPPDNTLIKQEMTGLNSNIANVTNSVQMLSGDVQQTNDTVKNLTGTVNTLGGEIKNVQNLLNDEILYKAHTAETNYQKYLDSAREEIKSLISGLGSFKKDITAINSGNVKILQEPIERAMAEFKNQEIGKEIKELSETLRDVAVEIQSSLVNMQNSMNDLNTAPGLKMLTEIADSIPEISDKLEIFRTHVVTENSTNLSNIKTSFSKVVQDVSESLKNAVDKIQDDTKTINIETLDTIKIDLQKLSDQLIDSVESVQNKVEKELGDFRSDFQEFTVKQQDGTDKVANKLASLEIGLENFSKDAIDRLNDAISAGSAQAQDNLNEIKSDILEGINESSKTTKTSIAQFEVKVDKLLNSYIGSDLENVVDKKSLRETVVDIETKIDRTNLQQIHNAKELLEEIQAGTQNLTMKLNALEDSKSMQGLLNVVSKISEKLQGIEDSNSDLSEGLENLKEKVEQKLKENVQKISALIENPKEDSLNKQNNNIDSLSNKVQEYLSNFEYLKSNISQEIKENLASEFKKIDNAIQRIKSSNDGSNYTYTLEDVESDLAKVKLTVEKSAANSEEFKTLFEKVIELRTVGLENVKINRDVEQELGHLSGWFKDTVNKIEDLTERIDNLQNIGFEDIKTRLVQSERSRSGSAELNVKLENALKTILKNSKAQDMKIDELNKKIEILAATQQEGFNPNQFIDIFYENMTQTKMLSNRVEIIEDKINTIQNCVEKLISYVEQ